MKKKSFTTQSCFVALTLVLTQNMSYAMPGMDMPAGENENAKPHPLAKSIGEPINSSASEFELAYSADGKTVVFVSTRPGSI